MVTGTPVSAVVLMIDIFSCFFFLSLFLQDVLAYSGVKTGICYLPMAVFLAGLAPLAGRLSARVGLRVPILAGLLFAALGVGWLSRVDVTSGYGSLVGGLMLVGMGLGLASPPISNAALSSVPAARAGVASGMNAMSRQVGGTIGIALLSALFAGRYHDHLNRVLAISGLSSALQHQIASEGTGTVVHSFFHQAFVQGMADTLTTFTVIGIFGVLVSLLIPPGDFLRHRPVTPREMPALAAAERP